MELKRNKRSSPTASPSSSSSSLSFKNKPSFFCSLSIFFLSFSPLLLTTIASTATSCLDISRCPASSKADLYFQDFEQRRNNHYMEEVYAKITGGRRLLSGPGSSPPRCTSKCGKCTPCAPVHVPVPPGTPVTAEYYPEAWRCKCGNKLYMP